MSGVNMNNDINSNRTVSLLRLMGAGRLPRESAGELRKLLKDRLDIVGKQNDVEHEARLIVLIQMLDNYIAGKIDLTLRPEMITTMSNVT